MFKKTQALFAICIAIRVGYAYIREFFAIYATTHSRFQPKSTAI